MPPHFWPTCAGPPPSVYRQAAGQQHPAPKDLQARLFARHLARHHRLGADPAPLQPQIAILLPLEFYPLGEPLREIQPTDPALLLAKAGAATGLAGPRSKFAVRLHQRGPRLVSVRFATLPGHRFGAISGHGGGHHTPSTQPDSLSARRASPLGIFATYTARWRSAAACAGHA